MDRKNLDKCQPGSSLKMRLEYYTFPVPESGCWIWMGSTGRNGYGQIHERRNRKQIAFAVHRLAWELHCGKIPTGMLICHRCDIKTCINPDHLFLGSYADNINDSIKKGRRTYNNSGTKNPRAKLNLSNVREIRASKEKIQKLADKYGVNNTQISRIRLYKTWRDI
jgi:hypothetical protein